MHPSWLLKSWHRMVSPLFLKSERKKVVRSITWVMGQPCPSLDNQHHREYFSNFEPSNTEIPPERDGSKSLKPDQSTPLQGTMPSYVASGQHQSF